MILQILLTSFLAAPVQPAFEGASVKVNRAGSAGGEGRVGESIVASPGSLTMRNASLNSPQKGPVDVLVIEHAEKVPADN